MLVIIVLILIIVLAAGALVWLYLTGRKARINEQRTRSMLENVPDAVVIVNARGLIGYWNAQAERIFGWSREEAIGRSMAETIVPPLYGDGHEHGLKNFFDTGDGPMLNRVSRLQLYIATVMNSRLR